MIQVFCFFNLNVFIYLLLFRKCQKVLGKNMELWENEVYRFKTIGQLKVGFNGCALKASLKWL